MKIFLTIFFVVFSFCSLFSQKRNTSYKLNEYLPDNRLISYIDTIVEKDRLCTKSNDEKYIAIAIVSVEDSLCNIEITISDLSNLLYENAYGFFYVKNKLVLLSGQRIPILFTPSGKNKIFKNLNVNTTRKNEIIYYNDDSETTCFLRYLDKHFQIDGYRMFCK